MKKVISMLLRHWIKSPVKISLTILSVALGTSILILSFSAGTIIEKEITSLMNSQGTILQVANGKWSANGEIEQQRPTTWDKSIKEKLITDSDLITDSSIIFHFPIPYISANGKSYQIRNIIGSDPSYLSLYALDIIAGIPMNNQDFDTGLNKIWISEETANIIFGSATNAIGKKISPPGKSQGGKTARFQITQYTVSGVYESPTEVARRAYGIADMVFPITSALPTHKKGPEVLDWLSGRLVVKSNSISLNKSISEINQIVANNFGQETEVTAWEGTPQGESSYMLELRQTISIFNSSIKILGLVLLLTSSLGIFSIMVVESIGRKKEIAIERALGASKIQVIKEFWQWSIVLSSFGAILGIGLSVLLSGSVLGTMSPLLSELSENIVLNTTIKSSAVITGVVLTLSCGGILGILPSFSVIKGDIADTLRES